MFASMENRILDKWDNEKLVQQLSDNSTDKPVFSFIDGPPFVSSENLHYGHLLVSYIKSCVLNFKQMDGYQVKNKLGYDCHGLPIEMVVNKILNIKTRDDVLKLGIDKYNQTCKEMIQKYSGAWEKIYQRIGRFADFSDNYKTVDPDFMENVWHCFKQLWDKDYVYKGYQIMPYSTACSTPLSNFEAGQNYKEVEDMSVFVSFSLKNDPTLELVVWTTTPWTLPSHIAICVNPELTYCILQLDDETKYIVAEGCIENLYPVPKKKKNYKPPYSVIKKMVGQELVGTEYCPPFDYITNRTFKVVGDIFVEATSGTGVVHMAPAHGEIDFEVCIKQGLVTKVDVDNYCLVDSDGCFKDDVVDFAKEYVFDANQKIVDNLKRRGLLVKKMMYKHSYPFCWRTDTPLIYKAVSSFFIKVTSIKDRMVELNKGINWVPKHIGTGRFNNWLETTRDWNVSRSRFFGTPLPIWASGDFEEMVCVGSVDELVDLAGLTERPSDLHRESVDHITIPSKTGRGMLRRVEDVFDCWFESGSVPFAQDTVADFICEGVDQTRGWFYTLLVESTAINNRVPFKNCICSGLILAEDGKKFSKRLNNFVSPYSMLEKYGSDSLRLYLVGSPAAYAESFRFSEEGVGIISRKLYQFYNGYKFLLEHTTKFQKDGHLFEPDFWKNSNNTMDRWILSKLGTICETVRNYMDSYKIYYVPNIITVFIEDLTNWYIKFNRNRLKGRNCTAEDQHCALSTLCRTFFEFCRISAPFIPFLTESIYLGLNGMLKLDRGSIHLFGYPKKEEFSQNSIIERRMDRLQTISKTVRTLRNRTPSSKSCRVPLKTVSIFNTDPTVISDLTEMERYLKEEINAVNVNYSSNIEVSYIAKPNSRNVGMKYRSLAKKVREHIQLLDSDTLMKYRDKEIDGLTITVDGKEIVLDDSEFVLDTVISVTTGPTEVSTFESGSFVVVDYEQTEDIVFRHLMRLFVVEVQNMRKNTKLHPWNKINIYYQTDDPKVLRALEKYRAQIVEDLIYQIYNTVPKSDDKLIVEEVKTVGTAKVKISITDPTGELVVCD